jgi:hypothetical protein
LDAAGCICASNRIACWIPCGCRWPDNGMLHERRTRFGAARSSAAPGMDDSGFSRVAALVSYHFGSYVAAAVVRFRSVTLGSSSLRAQGFTDTDLRGRRPKALEAPPQGCNATQFAEPRTAVDLSEAERAFQPKFDCHGARP